MEIRERLQALARIAGAPAPVISVYLGTRWADEHQRERVRIFLKNALRRARARGAGPEVLADLDWIEREAGAIVEEAKFPEAGVALFACGALGLRELLPVRVPFENAFVVADRPVLTPLAALLEGTPAALVAFVDGVSARLVTFAVAGEAEEVALHHEVPGRHRRGGWALLAQSRYQRHVQAHRGQHFEAVAASLGALVQEHGIDRLVLAGEPRTLAVFRRLLPPALAGRVAGTIPASRHEGPARLIDRASRLLARRQAETEACEVDQVLTGDGGPAVVGIEPTLDALARGAIRRLYLLKGLDAAGRRCHECGGLQAGREPRCRACGGFTRDIRLADEMVDRVLAAGGEVAVVEAHAGLSQAGGSAARLRYPLRAAGAGGT